MWNDNKALAVMVAVAFLAMASCQAVKEFSDAKYKSEQCSEGKTAALKENDNG